MTSWPGCNAYQGTRSTSTGVWLPCESCSVPWEAHSPEARWLQGHWQTIDMEHPDGTGPLVAGAPEMAIAICPTCGAHRSALSDPDANRAGIAGARRTSAAAALRVQPRTGTQRRAILDYIALYGPLTDAQIQEGLGISGNTERPRRVELVEGGWLEESGTLRLGSGQTVGILWQLTSQARARLQGAA